MRMLLFKKVFLICFLVCFSLNSLYAAQKGNIVQLTTLKDERKFLGELLGRRLLSKEYLEQRGDETHKVFESYQWSYDDLLQKQNYVLLLMLSYIYCKSMALYNELKHADSLYKISSQKQILASLKQSLFDNGPKVYHRIGQFLLGGGNTELLKKELADELFFCFLARVYGQYSQEQKLKIFVDIQDEIAVFLIKNQNVINLYKDSRVIERIKAVLSNKLSFSA